MSQIQKHREQAVSARLVQLSRLGQTSLLEPITSIRPSIYAGVGFAGLLLGSKFVPEKSKTLKKGLMIAAALSGAAAAWLFYLGR